jgi:hypothetical protein
MTAPLAEENYFIAFLCLTVVSCSYAHIVIGGTGPLLGLIQSYITDEYGYFHVAAYRRTS